MITNDSFGFDLSFTFLFPVRVGGPYMWAAARLSREPAGKGSKLCPGLFESERAGGQVLTEQDGSILPQLYVNGQREHCC